MCTVTVLNCHINRPVKSSDNSREFSRYEFYHEVLGKAESYFMGMPVLRSRRISIVCRDLPRNVQQNELHPTNNITEKRELLQQSDVEQK